MDNYITGSSGSDDIQLMYCVIPRCTRLLISVDPSVIATELGALPKITPRFTRSKWSNARDAWVLQCHSCERNLPDLDIETDPPCTKVSNDAQVQWEIMRDHLKDTQWKADWDNEHREGVLTEAEEMFLSQNEIPCALSGCNRLFSRDDERVTITRKGAVPPTLNLSDDKIKTYCVLEDCEREVEEPTWVEDKHMVQRYGELGDLLNEFVMRGFKRKIARLEENRDRQWLEVGGTIDTDENGQKWYRY
jgi:hypothetical protein